MCMYIYVYIQYILIYMSNDFILTTERCFFTLSNKSFLTSPILMDRNDTE